MDSQVDADRWREIQSTLNSILEISDRRLSSIRERERRTRLASSFLIGFLVFATLEAVFVGLVVVRPSPDYFRVLIGRGSPVLSLTGPAALAAIASGLAVYFLLKRRQESGLNELSTLVAEMRGYQRPDREGKGVAEGALSIADKITTLLPGVIRKRNLDSLLIGLVAFIIATFVARSLPIAIGVGVAIWLFFRYEGNKTYEKEALKFEEQWRLFEQRKKDFAEALE